MCISSKAIVKAATLLYFVYFSQIHTISNEVESFNGLLIILGVGGKSVAFVCLEKGLLLLLLLVLLLLLLLFLLHIIIIIFNLNRPNYL